MGVLRARIQELETQAENWLSTAGRDGQSSQIPGMFSV